MFYDKKTNEEKIVTAEHRKTTQWIHISFNQVVTFVSCGNHEGELESGDGTTTLVLVKHEYSSYHDSIGISKLVVNAGPGLAIVNVFTTD